MSRSPDSLVSPSEPQPVLSLHRRAHRCTSLEQVIAEMARLRDGTVRGVRVGALFRQTLTTDATQTARAGTNVRWVAALFSVRAVAAVGGGRRASSGYLSAVSVSRADTLAGVRTQTGVGSLRHAEIDQLTQHVAALEFCVALVDLVQLDVAGDQVVELKVSFFPSVQELRHIDAEPVATH